MTCTFGHLVDLRVLDHAHIVEVDIPARGLVVLQASTLTQLKCST